MAYQIDFYFHEGFTERLLSGHFSIYPNQELKYLICYFPDGETTGVIEINDDLIDQINKLTFIEELPSSYEGCWDGMGSSDFKIKVGNKAKIIKINEIIDRDALVNETEVALFKLNDLLIKLASEIHA